MTIENKNSINVINQAKPNTILITVEQIRKICPFAPKGLDAYIPYLNKFMAQYKINTLKRIRSFIAQLAHESGQFKHTFELASGKAYEGNKKLGNIHPGDGVKFKGRGLIQITGRYNYRACSLALFGDERLLNTPQLLESPQYAVESACWFWDNNNLNKYADIEDFPGLTKRINGGLNGFVDRKSFWEVAKKVIV